VHFGIYYFTGQSRALKTVQNIAGLTFWDGGSILALTSLLGTSLLATRDQLIFSWFCHHANYLVTSFKGVDRTIFYQL
jgi:hypothetical protein